MRIRTAWLTRAFTTHGTTAFVAAASVVGRLVGLAAAALFLLVGWIGDLVEIAGDELGSWTILLIVPAGIVTSWLIARRFGSDVEGGGVTETMAGLSLHGGYLPGSTIGPKLAATAATLGAGGSGGRESPVVMIGGAIGSWFARHTRFGEDQIRSEGCSAGGTAGARKATEPDSVASSAGA